MLPHIPRPAQVITVDLRELEQAVNRSGLLADVAPADAEEHVDKLLDTLCARVAPRPPPNSSAYSSGASPRAQALARAADAASSHHAPADGGRSRVGLGGGRLGRGRARGKGGSKLGGWQLASGDAGKPVAEQLRSALTRQAVRVIDLFREWDTTPDGELTLQEFHTGIKRLGFPADAAAIAALFRSWDADGSGCITLLELNKILRRGGTVSLPEALRYDPEAHAKRKEGETKEKAMRAARKLHRTLHRAPLPKTSPAMSGDSEKLLKRMAKHRERLLQTIAGWDINQDGVITRAEFHRALPSTGVVADKSVIDELFDTLDHERAGRVAVEHVTSCLRWACKNSKDSHVLHVKFDEQLPLAEQLKDALSANAARVIDLFREFDTDGDGEVSLVEFQKALPLLGLPVTPEQCKEVFESFDGDGSGAISFREFNRLLRRDTSASPKKKKKDGPAEVVEVVSLTDLKQQMLHEVSKLLVS